MTNRTAENVTCDATAVAFVTDLSGPVVPPDGSR